MRPFFLSFVPDWKDCRGLSIAGREKGSERRKTSFLFFFFSSSLTLLLCCFHRNRDDAGRPSSSFSFRARREPRRRETIRWPSTHFFVRRERNCVRLFLFPFFPFLPPVGSSRRPCSITTIRKEKKQQGLFSFLDAVVDVDGEVPFPPK